METSWVKLLEKAKEDEREKTQEEIDAEKKAELAKRGLPAPMLKKTLVKDLLPQLKKDTQGAVPFMLAMANCKDGVTFVVNKVESAGGENQLLLVD